MLCWMLSNCHRFAPFFSSGGGVNASHPCLPALVIPLHFLHCLLYSLIPLLPYLLPLSPSPHLPSTPHRAVTILRENPFLFYPDYHLAPLRNWTVLPGQWNCIGIQYPAEWSSGGSWIPRGSTKTVWVLYCAVKDTLLFNKAFIENNYFSKWVFPDLIALSSFYPLKICLMIISVWPYLANQQAHCLKLITILKHESAFEQEPVFRHAKRLL